MGTFDYFPRRGGGGCCVDVPVGLGLGVHAAVCGVVDVGYCGCVGVGAVLGV